MSQHNESVMTAEADRSHRKGDQSRGNSQQSSGRPNQGSGSRSSATQFSIPMLFFDPTSGQNNFKEFKEAADMAAAAEFPGAAGELIRNGKYSLPEPLPMPISHTMVDYREGDEIKQRRVDNTTHAAEMFKYFFCK